MARKETELRPVMTRIPESLRRRLEREAARNDRSMNAEIIHRLSQSFLLPDQGELIRNVIREEMARVAIPSGPERSLADLGKPWPPSKVEAAEPNASAAEKAITAIQELAGTKRQSDNLPQVASKRKASGGKS